MLYPSINEIRKKADSRYTLAMLAAKRARDLIDGKPPLVDIDCDRPVSIAANEIAEDLITYKRVDAEEEAEGQAGNTEDAADDADEKDVSAEEEAPVAEEEENGQE